jgi:hypothetical protein
MGQYYKPVNLDKKQYVYSHDYGNGLKLMEHSWIDNNFVAIIENLIKKGGDWYKNHIVWAGDYAEKEPNTSTKKYPDGKNLYQWVGENTIKPITKRNPKLRYLKNLDTKEFVDLKKVPVCEVTNNFKWRIHPLPLLTCEGNGQGGGDYYGEDKNNLIGRWARNRVTIQSHKPKDGIEIVFDLIEK